MNKDGTGSVNSVDLIGYKALSEAALKGAMRDALKIAAKGDAMPGSHHFYITFRTAAQGVTMADAIKDRFPEEMTIVIQHQYWDFAVHEDNFEIVLKFGGVPQLLIIPFAAITRFFDPSVNYGLVFELGTAALINDGKEVELFEEKAPAPKAPKAKVDAEATVVSLDAFRRK